MSQWISVEDRLPEKDGAYLTILDGRGHGYYGHPEITYGSHDWHCFWNARGAMIVTHWMPLPEPPERSKDNEW